MYILSSQTLIGVIVDYIKHMSNFDHYLVIILIMLFAGLLGGYGNYLVLTLPNNTDPTPDPEDSVVRTEDNHLLIRSMILGLIASFLVPLFLKTISSNLLDKPVVVDKEDPYLFNANYLVLIGFCLLAAVLSKQFIEGLYEKVMKAQADATKAVNKAEEASKKAKNVEADLTEKEAESSQTNELNLNPSAANLSPSLEEKVIASIAESKYIWRSVSGIAKNLNLKKNDVTPVVQKLVDAGKLEMKTNSENQLRFKIRI